jgi:hypothetical protein
LRNVLLMISENESEEMGIGWNEKTGAGWQVDALASWEHPAVCSR